MDILKFLFEQLAEKSGLSKVWLLVIAIAIVVLIGAYRLVKWLSTKREERRKKEIDDAMDVWSSIDQGHPKLLRKTPSEIESEVKTIPIIARDEFREKTYTNMYVKWDAELQTVSVYKGVGRAYLRERAKPFGYNFLAEFNLEKHPFLKVAKEGMKITVFGKIIRFDEFEKPVLKVYQVKIE